MSFVEFREPGDYGRVVTINSDHVQSVTPSDYVDPPVSVTRIVLASGEEWFVSGDYATVLARLNSRN